MAQARYIGVAGGPGGIFVAQVSDSSDPADTVTKMFEIDIAGGGGCSPQRPTRRGDRAAPHRASHQFFLTRLQPALPAKASLYMVATIQTTMAA